MKKPGGRVNIFDKLHRFTVYGLLGLTAYGTYICSMGVYNYFAHVRPAYQERMRKIREDEIASEQQERENELLRRQKDAETLIS